MKFKFIAGDSWNGSQDGDELKIEVDSNTELTKNYDYWPNKGDLNGDGPDGKGWKDE